MRLLCLLSFGCLVGLLLYTYDVKYKTRELETRALALAAELQDESDYLALMRAETAHLAAPERIEDMAKKQLKFEPVAPAQTVSWKAVLASAEPSWQPQTEPAPAGIAALIGRSQGPAAASATR
jgi:cell division protein FtsL